MTALKKIETPIEIIFKPGDLIKIKEPDLIIDLNEIKLPLSGFFHGLILRKKNRHHVYGHLYDVLVNLTEFELWWDEMEKIV